MITFAHSVRPLFKDGIHEHPLKSTRRGVIAAIEFATAMVKKGDANSGTALRIFENSCLHEDWRMMFEFIRIKRYFD
jgi:hypothetical protein